VAQTFFFTETISAGCRLSSGGYVPAFGAHFQAPRGLATAASAIWRLADASPSPHFRALLTDNPTRSYILFFMVLRPLWVVASHLKAQSKAQ
jgi:hypothetical protein